MHLWRIPEMVGTPKWMIYNGKFYESGWYGGTPILGNYQYVCIIHQLIFSHASTKKTWHAMTLKQLQDPRRPARLPSKCCLPRRFTWKGLKRYPKSHGLSSLPQISMGSIPHFRPPEATSEKTAASKLPVGIFSSLNPPVAAHVDKLAGW